MLTGRFFPVHKIELLNRPMAVKGWTPAGLLLAAGRRASLPGLRTLPSASPALTEMTKRRVEIVPNGQVFGLVRVHHRCGNDPVREAIASVDLADVLMFLLVGQTAVPVPQAEWTAGAAGTSHRALRTSLQVSASNACGV
jgi:hypothetical protein